MAITQVIKGIGEGSLFRYGRFFGVHNPLGSKLGKAKDPFINLKTLARLSYEASPIIRNAVIKNLVWGKFLSGFIAKVTPRFNSEVFIDALAGSVIIKTLPEKPLGLPQEISSIIEKAAPKELERLSKSKCPKVLECVAKNQKTPRNVLFDLIINQRIPNYISLTAYSTLERDLTTDELNQIADDPLLKERVVLGAHASAEAIANALSKVIKKSGQKREAVKVKEGDPFYGDQRLGLIPIKGGTIHGMYKQIDVYSHNDIKAALAFLFSYPPAKQREIFSELKKINPELANLIKEKLPA